MEGILPNNLLQMENAGFTVIPPDPFGNLQRIWVPRTSLVAVEVLGVVGSPLRKRKPKPSQGPDRPLRRRIRDRSVRSPTRRRPSRHFETDEKNLLRYTGI